MVQPVRRLTWATSAVMNLICKGYDVGNASAEAPAPTSPFFMKPDPPVPTMVGGASRKGSYPNSHVIPVRKVSQGYPESPQL